AGVCLVDPFGCDFEKTSIANFRLNPGLVGALSLRDVHEDANGALQLAIIIHQWRARDDDRSPSPATAQNLQLVTRCLARDTARFLLRYHFQAVGCHKAMVRHPGERFHILYFKHATHAWIAVDGVALEVDMPDTNGAALSKDP